MKCTKCDSFFYTCPQFNPENATCPACGGEGKGTSSKYNLFGNYEEGRASSGDLSNVSYEIFRGLLLADYQTKLHDLVRKWLRCEILKNDKGEPLLQHTNGRYIPLDAGLLRILINPEWRKRLESIAASDEFMKPRDALEEPHISPGQLDNMLRDPIGVNKDTKAKTRRVLREALGIKVTYKEDGSPILHGPDGKEVSLQDAYDALHKDYKWSSRLASICWEP